jgi:catechol 2,3-dioxygenase-like lactoylglutathione lyase family enzyme
VLPPAPRPDATVGDVVHDEVMIDHIGINCADLRASGAFYDRVLATLGHTRLMDYGVAVGYGTTAPQFWISSFEDMGPNREVHVAFIAPDAERVRAFYAAALDGGAESLHEPRLWPEYHPNYYGAFVRDPDGNNVEAVCHTVDAGQPDEGQTPVTG